MTTHSEQETWYYTKGGRRLGPVNFDDLQKLCQSHTLNETTLVWEPSFGQEWREIFTVDGMIEKEQVPHLPANQIRDIWLNRPGFAGDC